MSVEPGPVCSTGVGLFAFTFSGCVDRGQRSS